MPIISKSAMAAIFLSMGSLIVGGFYLLFNYYVQETSLDFLNNWLQAEGISIAEGNLLTSVTKNQRVLLFSDLIRGISLVDLSTPDRQEQIHSGEVIDAAAIRDLGVPGKANIQSIGFFKKLSYTRIPGHEDLMIIFYVFSKSVQQLFFVSCGIFLALIGVFLGIILRLQKIELLRRQKTISEYAEKAARVAHDIRSPLGMIESIAERNKNLHPTISTQITAALQRVDEITADFIQNRSVVAQFKLQKTVPAKMERYDYDLASVLRELVSIKNMQFSGTGVEITSTIDFTQGEFTIAKSEITQVLSSLIDNSVDAKSQKITVDSLVRDNVVILEVVDDGVGMPSAVLEKIGTKGFTAGKENGSGLGVYYSRNYIENAGGSIKYESKNSSGTTVKIELPYVAPVMAEINVNGKELLILDDEPVLIQGWKQYLSSYPNLPVHYFTDPGALKNFVGKNTDKYAIITDFDLKADMDGVDVITALGITIPGAVVVTAHATAQTVCQKADRAGVPVLGKNRIADLKIITG